MSHQPPQMPQLADIPDIKYSVAVASGKGGVGKSTVSVNLAVALSRSGAKVGLMDADIYGPNVPMMMGISEPPQVVKEKIRPIEKYGIKLISMGFFLKEDEPVIWRGPMVHGAIRQFVADVDWGELDYLLIDLPPGTGDAQLSLSQTLPLSGAVIVTTPQGVSLADARKAVGMFEKVNVPILGLIENMSYFICPNCNARHEIFSTGGGSNLAEQLGLTLLGQLPLYTGIREGGDEGNPIVLREPESEPARLFFESAGKLAEVCQALPPRKSPHMQPVIFESK